MGAADDLYLQGNEKIAEAHRRFDRIWADARAAFNRARQRSGDRDSCRFCVDLLDGGTYLLGLRQHPRERVEWLTVAIGATRAIGDGRGEGNALGNLGIAYWALGQVQKAIGCHEQALVISRAIGDRRAEGQDLG